MTRITRILKSGFLAGIFGGLLLLPTIGAAQGLVRLYANSPATISTMTAAEERPVRLIVSLKTPDSFAGMSNNLTTLMSEVTSAQTRAVDDLGWLKEQTTAKFELIPALALTANKSQIEDLLRSSQVAAVYEDQILYRQLKSTGPIIGTPRAHRMNATGKGQVIAVLDGGFDPEHPFYADRVVEEACFSAGPDRNKKYQITMSNCPNGQAVDIGPGASGIDTSFEPGGDEHGTHVAGIAAGRGRDFSGVAPEAGMILVNVFIRKHRLFCDNPMDNGQKWGCTTTRTSYMISALEWIYRQRKRYNIAAINISLGGGRANTPCDDGDPNALIYKLFRLENIPIIVASGNESHKGSISSPACYSGAISVGASTRKDEVPDFSNSAVYLDLLAPGVDVNSAKPGGSFQSLRGTSMAAPHVAGAFAVLRSVKPTATIDEMLKVLRDTGVPVKDVNDVVKPRIQIDRAVAALRSGGTGWNTSAQKPKAASKRRPVVTRSVKKVPDVVVIEGIAVHRSTSGKVRRKSGGTVNKDGTIKW
jgi:subtilisin family serine protease